ncbi:MAG: alpha/beta fold hydrolase [bacterium]|nr:alpha/beta fold hydrolase [bacterium]
MFLEAREGIRLYYEVHGEPDRPPVVLLHGLGADEEMWRPQIARYPSEGFRAIVPVLRGHGRSSATRAFRVSDCAGDLEALLVHLGVPRAALVGVSLGGAVAQQFALDYPEKVEKLVLADSFSGQTGSGTPLGALLSELLLRLVPKPMLQKTPGLVYRKPEHELVRRYFERRLEESSLATLRAIRIGAGRFSVLDQLPRIKAPTLVLVGDLFGSYALRLARATASGIPGATLKVLEGGGDPSNLLAPESFDRAVLEFIRPEIDRP